MNQKNSALKEDLDNLDTMVGFDFECSGFTDGKTRVGHRIKLSDFKEFLNSVVAIPYKTEFLWASYLKDNDKVRKNLATVFNLTFDEDFESLEKVMTFETLKSIYDVIIKENGIEVKEGEARDNSGK